MYLGLSAWRITVGIAAVGNFIGAVQHLQLVEAGTWMSFMSQPNGSNALVSGCTVDKKCKLKN